METLLQLIENMSHSTGQGIVGVTGIFLFLVLIVGAGIYRAKEMQEHDTEHH